MADQPTAREAMVRTAASEAVSLAMIGAVVWYFGPGRRWITARRAQLAARWHARQRAIDLEVSDFGREISRAEHERLGR
jgi:hypothetical protein